jgi:hypothetical protein
MAPADPFARLAGSLRRDPRVGEMEMFGAQGFKVSGKVFAIFWKGDLVLKLPADRAQALVASKAARPWAPGHGRKMKEWIAFSPHTSRRWLTLAEEARDFVAAGASGVSVRSRRS